MSEFKGEIIIQYLENSISESDEIILLEWLQASDENMDMFLTCKKIYAVSKIKHYSQPAILEQAIRKFNFHTNSIKKERKREFAIQLSKYAAILFFIIAIPFTIWQLVKEKPIEYATVTVENLEPVKIIVLPDGSKVWINKGSSFTYPLSFGKNERNVRLNGEAFLNVKTDSLHPFIVHANNIQVKVFGTSFNVNTNTTDSSIKTVLVTGRVAIRDAKGKSLALLSPGQLATFDQHTLKIELSNVKTDIYTAWHKGLFVFDKADLKDIINKIAEVYNIRITINSKNQSQYKINFVFRDTQSLDTVLEMLKFVAPITYKKNDEQIYINIK